MTKAGFCFKGSKSYTFSVEKVFLSTTQQMVLVFFAPYSLDLSSKPLTNWWLKEKI